MYIKKKLVDNFFKLDALGKRKQNGSSNHVPPRNMFQKEKGNNIQGRRGGTSLWERGLSCFGEQHDLKILIPNFSVQFERFHKECLIWTVFLLHFLAKHSKICSLREVIP